MKRPNLIFGILLSLVFSLHGAETIDESQLIQVLQSDASLQKKDAACTQLKRIGTERCIDALAALLIDEQLSHSARYALESMPSPSAGAALIGALKNTSGLTRSGIINSLAVRREAPAVPALATILTEGNKGGRIAFFDDESNIAAVSALGEIATPRAVKVLESAQAKSSGPLHSAIADALLRSANHMLDSGDRSRAAALFGRIYSAEKDGVIRIAAYGGSLRASSKPATLFSEALLGAPGPKQTAALQLARQADFPDAVPTFAALLPKAATHVQLALIEALKQRGDPIAARSITSLAGSSRPPVRTAALAALGQLGDGSLVPMLAEAAVSGTEDEKAAARQALVELHNGDPTKDLLECLAKANPDTQIELARALGQRGNTEAIPKLLELASQSSDSSRKTALQALALLAGEKNLPSLVQLVVGAQTEAARSEAADALREALQRLLMRDRHLDLTFLVTTIESSQPAQRIALLPVCSILTDDKIRLVLRNAVADPRLDVHSAAVRALCDTRDIELLPDIVRIALAAPEENLRALATAASVRLTSQDEGAKLPNDIRLMPLKALLKSNPSLAQKRMILAGLAEIPDRESLVLAEPLLNENQVQNEAVFAVIKLAPTLADGDQAIGALKKVLAITNDTKTRADAEAILKKLQSRSAVK